MMKKYFNIFTKTLFFLSLIMILISFIITRVTDHTMLYTKITIGGIIMALIIAFAIIIFQSNKGNGVINTILGYIIIIPALFVFRAMFGQYLFYRIWYLYILILIIGVIYVIALFFASKKYKSEVKELNRLLKIQEEKTKEDK